MHGVTMKKLVRVLHVKHSVPSQYAEYNHLPEDELSVSKLVEDIN